MSCPNWPQLLDQRRAGGEDPGDWRQAVEHLERCRRCRRTVFQLEPTLLFTALPEPELAADEARRMVAVLQSLRRGALRSRARRRTTALRLAAGIVLVAGALLLVPQRRVNRSQASPAARGGGFSHVLPAQQGGNALLALQSPAARVYEVEAPDMAVVMVVDGTLDLGDDR